MALGAQTPRDQLDRLLALVKRAVRYWWVAAIVGVIGTALSVALALVRVNAYESASVIMYQEVISARLLLGSSAAGDRSRGMAMRFREMTMARPLLEEIIEEHNMYPGVVETEGMDAAIDKMRLRVGFRSGGGGTFTISFRGDTRDEAQAIAASMATRLIEWEKDLLINRSNRTKDFLESQRTMAEATLQDREHDLAAFLRAHPEFAGDTATANRTGAGVRAAQQSSARPAQRITDPNFLALERQRSRIKSRLAAGAGLSRRGRRQPSAGEQQAESAVRLASRALDTAKRNLDNKQAHFTDEYPGVVSAKTKVRAAEQRVAETRAQLAAIQGVSASPASNEDIEKLREELKDINRKIGAYRRRHKKDNKLQADVASEDVDHIVLLETEHQRLRREVSELREQYESLEAKAFTAEMAAASEVATQGSQLTIIEPAYRPSRPVGAARSILVMMGAVVFAGIGVVFAFGFALVDDRIVSKYDIERLELVPVLTVIPKHKKRRRGSAKSAKAREMPVA